MTGSYRAVIRGDHAVTITAKVTITVKRVYLA
jgi:hypothetical protein